MAQLLAMPAPGATHLIEATKSDPRFRIKTGDRFEAYSYVMDPSSKWVLVRQVPGGRDPGCTAYKSSFKVVRDLYSPVKKTASKKRALAPRLRPVNVDF